MSRNRLFRTSSFRLTLLYAALFGGSVLALFGVIYLSATDYALEDEADEVDVEFTAIQDEAHLAGNALLPTIIDNHLKQRHDSQPVYLLEDSGGHKIAGNIDERPPQMGDLTISVPLDGKTRKVLAHGYRLDNGDYLLIGQDGFAVREMEELIAGAFGFAAVGTLVLAIIGGLVISRSVLGRVEAVSQTTRAIVGGDLARRVPTRGSDDEFDHLAVSVNAMLDRIEDLMRSMRQVSNDIAHDLRTPLTRLRQRLEQAHRRGGTEQELRDALGGSIGQIDTILETFGALLRIAQIEAGGETLPLAPVEISKLLADIIADFAPAAEDRGQTLTADVDAGLSVCGDRELLIQMVVNLVDNAIRHSPPGGQISIGAHIASGGVEIAVADGGPGIPADERGKVLRPFYRLESSRTTLGNGLGLSLVAAIAKHHRAPLTLGDNRPGLRVSIVVPLDPEALPLI